MASGTGSRDDEYVIDRHDLIWRVVRDGGMATRAGHGGVLSAGIDWLEREQGPLVRFTASKIRDLLAPV